MDADEDGLIKGFPDYVQPQIKLVLHVYYIIKLNYFAQRMSEFKFFVIVK